MASPFTTAGSLLISAGAGRQGTASLCTETGGTLSCPGGFAGRMTWLGGSGSNSRQILGPAGSFSSNFNYRWSDSVPTTATLMKIGTPSSGESSLGPAIPDTDYVTPSGSGNLQNKTLDGSNVFSSYLPWAQISKPGAPAAGYLRVYAKTGEGICWVNSAGTETCAGASGGGLSDPGSTGLVVETSPGTTANRTISAGSSNVSVTNGSGTGGNPTIDIGSTIDFTGKATSPVQVGSITGMPASCAVGQLYFASDGVNGRKLQTCTSLNTWTPVGYEQGAVNPATCSVGQVFFNTGAPVGRNLYFCTASNTWTQMHGDVTSAFGRTGAVTAQAGDYTYAQISNTPAALPPNGAASGDLSGSYPNPTVSQVNGAAIPVSGMLKANSSRQLVQAVAGSDYAPATSGTGLLKGNGTGGFAGAASGVDYAPATNGSSMLKANGSGGFTNATAGSDYAPVTSGTGMLKGNGAGGFSNSVAGTDYMATSTPLQASQMPALSGDCVSTAGSLSTTCAKTNGVAFAASATTDSSPVTSLHVRPPESPPAALGDSTVQSAWTPPPTPLIAAWPTGLISRRFDAQQPPPEARDYAGSVGSVWLISHRLFLYISRVGRDQSVNVALESSREAATGLRLARVHHLELVHRRHRGVQRGFQNQLHVSQPETRERFSSRLLRPLASIHRRGRSLCSDRVLVPVFPSPASCCPCTR